MGYGGKTVERARARELRAQAWTLQEIADELGVSKSLVSLWVRDVDFEPRPRNRGHPSQKPHPLAVREQAQVEECRRQAREWADELSARERTMFALGLYAGEGTKRDGTVAMANTDSALLVAFVGWMRAHFDVDERRLRVRLYLHDDLDEGAAVRFWSGRLAIPAEQFTTPFRPIATTTLRRGRHMYGCASVRYACAETHRKLIAMIEAVTSADVGPG